MTRKYTSSIFYCCKLVINFLIFVEAEYIFLSSGRWSEKCFTLPPKLLILSANLQEIIFRGLLLLHDIENGVLKITQYKSYSIKEKPSETILILIWSIVRLILTVIANKVFQNKEWILCLQFLSKSV